MSLYDGLDVDTGPSPAKKSNKSSESKSGGGGKPDVSGWSAGIRMMQSHLRMKKAALTEAQRKIRGATLAPVVDLKKSSNVAAEELGPMLPPSSSPPRSSYGGSKSSSSAESPDSSYPWGGRQGSSRGMGKPDPDTLHSEFTMRPQSRSKDVKPSSLSQMQQPSSSVPGGPRSASDVGKEYDPAYPNEYEKVVKMIRDKRMKEMDSALRNSERGDRGDRDNRDSGRRKRDHDRRDRDRDRDDRGDRPRSPKGFSRKPDSEDEEDDRSDRDRRKRVASKAAIAPPSSLIQQDSVIADEPFAPPAPPGGKKGTIGDLINRRKGRGRDDHQDPERSTTPPPGSQFQDPDDEFSRPSFSGGGSKPKNFAAPVGLGADSVAAKIMAKYGFREGSGLGKHEQGLSTALQVEKTSKRGGKIIESSKAGNDPDAMMKEPMMPPPPMPAGLQKTAGSGSDLTSVLKNPSKVVLLRNMVGPGEVDDDLQPETAEECSKYGPVNKVIIYEEPGATPDEAVRIFVEFHRIESAIKAVVDLNGRYFGGRIVKGGFYKPEKFKNLELNAIVH